MELFSICDGLPSTTSRIDQLLSYGVDLDISDDVCSFIICILWVMWALGESFSIPKVEGGMIGFNCKYLLRIANCEFFYVSQ